ncbi:MAG: hypothetical protein HW416_1158 [Chloroflexi bacterium]|nr:hypothetical protein [Chloroflexota bacterium]
MSTNLGPLLPQPLVELLSGADLQSKVGMAAVLVTPGADGYPHPAIITPGEIVASDASTLRVALYQESSASRNLRERKVGTLCLALDNAAYYVKFDAEPFASDAEAFKGLAVFTLRPRHVLKDAEEGAEVTSGFRFRDLRGEEALIAQWTPMVGALRRTFTGG